MTGEELLDAAYKLQNTDGALVHYEAWASTYDDEVGRKHRYAQPRRCAFALAECLDPTVAEVLDVDCGTGLSGLALADAGFSTLDGCDLSPAMLKQAERTRTYRRLFEANLNDGIDVLDDTYDAVTAVGVLLFGHVQTDALREMLRVLRPEGVLVVGLNDHYWADGAVPAELEAIEADGRGRVLMREHGKHPPGSGIQG